MYIVFFIITEHRNLSTRLINLFYTENIIMTNLCDISACEGQGVLITKIQKQLS